METKMEETTTSQTEEVQPSKFERLMGALPKPKMVPSEVRFKARQRLHEVDQEFLKHMMG